MRQKITKHRIDALTPGNRDAFLWDTQVHGFGLKITPRGTGVYLLQYRVAGRLRRYTIGKHGSPWTPEQARNEAKRLLGEVSAGRDPAEYKSEGRKAPTLLDASKRYLSEHAEVKKQARSIREDSRLLDKLILPVLGAHKVLAITRGDIAKLHHTLRDAPYQANRAVALLSKVFNLSEQWGYRSDGTNPCRHIEKFKERKRERFLSDSELARLGAVLAKAEQDNQESPGAIAAIRLLVLTGARLSEILTCRWEFVDLDRSMLFLPNSKSGAKVIQLGAAALNVLAKIPEEDENPFVIVGERPRSHLVGLPKVWRRIRAAAGLANVRLHDLRHSYASIAAARGNSLLIIGALLGHKNQATTARYAHLANHPVKVAADTVSARIWSTLTDGDDASVSKIIQRRSAAG